MPKRGGPWAAIRDSECGGRRGPLPRQGGAEATYQSFSSPEPRVRRLEPHALVFDGFRWHSRARDADENRFRDFVLGRLSNLAVAGPATVATEEDMEWNTRVALVIAPHPGLAPHQRSAIAADYGMTAGHLILRPRAAVAWYVKRRLGLVEGHTDRPAAEQHIVLISETIESESEDRERLDARPVGKELL